MRPSLQLNAGTEEVGGDPEQGDEAESRGQAAESIRDPSEILARAETDLYVKWVVYKGDDAAQLTKQLRQVEGLCLPLPPGKKLLLHWDHAVEVEASLAFTTTHCPFTRVPYWL